MAQETPKGRASGSLARIGTAGWSVPARGSGAFGKEGSQLERYGAQFSCVEINSTFYRPHRPQTYVRWAASVPDHFRFAVKTPRAITHDAKLRESRAALQAFVEQISFLGPKLGPLLVQLPPSLPFDAAVAEAFIKDLRSLFGGDVVLEPRHPTWFAAPCEEWLQSHRIGRVGADPAPDPRAKVPGGIGLRYWRLHGSPQMYHSAYGESRLRPIAGRWRPNDWCVFDNTASGAALADALLLQRLVDEAPGNA